MDAFRTDLWQRICAFEFDEPGTQLTFAARLARENGWSSGFARRVVDEYRRFLYMAMVAGHEVTPSEHVDEAWHLHLVYTRSYWDDLCPNVLGRPLHHNPTRGGAAENSRHHEQYNQTLASYESHFGEAAPADIWPPAEIRFGEDLEHVRTSRTRNWIIPKPRLWSATYKPTNWLVTTAIAPLLVGVIDPFDLRGLEFLTLYGMVTAMVIVAAVILRRWLREGEPADDTKPLEPEEIACLGRGAAGVLQSSLAGLVAQGRMEIVETPGKKWGAISVGKATYTLRAAALPETAESEIERTMLGAARRHTGTDAAEILRAAKPVAETIESKLQSRRLLETSDSFGPARWWPIILIGALALFGTIKLVVGVSRDKPIMFLAIWLIALVVVAALFAKKPLRTLRGDRLLKELKSRHEKLKKTKFAHANSISPADLMIVAGLFGIAAVDHPQVQTLKSALQPIAPSDGGLAGLSGGCSGGCAGGGGCGGGGGGGGCGGCGGGD